MASPKGDTDDRAPLCVDDRCRRLWLAFRRPVVLGALQQCLVCRPSHVLGIVCRSHRYAGRCAMVAFEIAIGLLGVVFLAYINMLQPLQGRTLARLATTLEHRNSSPVAALMEGATSPIDVES